jgi:hypothetical protein
MLLFSVSIAIISALLVATYIYLPKLLVKKSMRLSENSYKSKKI